MSDSWLIDKVFENTRQWEKESVPHAFHIYGQRGSVENERRTRQSPSFVEWRVKFARGYLANGQIKGLVDNLWRFQSFNARHKTPITAEGESEDPREGSHSSSLSVAFGLV